MRYLIDTNIFLFFALNPALLDRKVLAIITNVENRVYLSSECVKEVIHLVQVGRVRSKLWKTADDIFSFIEKETDFTISYVKKEHLLTLAGLALVSGHNDPSDRLIIAQAITEKVPLISSDAKFAHYENQRLNFIFNKK